MANKFVWSGASGGNDGSTWEDAYTTLMRDWGAEASFTPATDFIYVRSVHGESTTGVLTLLGGTVQSTSVFYPRIISVVGDTTGTTPGNLEIGASVTVTDANHILIREGIYIYGVDFISGDDVRMENLNNDIVLERCRLEVANGGSIFVGASGSVSTKTTLLDTDIDPGPTATAHIFIHRGGPLVLWDGGTLEAASSAEMIGSDARGFSMIIRNVDLSVQTAALIKEQQSGSGVIRLERCLLEATPTFVSSAIFIPNAFTAIQCQNGTDADPAFQLYHQTKHGIVSSDVSTYRTGGAKDGERTNPISWDMSTADGNVASYPGHTLESVPIVGWTDGDGSTAHTYRIYFASGATQQDDDVWFDIILPNDAATNSLGVRKTNRVDPETAAANHMTDGVSTWVGADRGTVQYMEVTHTPDKPGEMKAYIHMVADAGSAGHIFVDPKIYIDE